MDTETFYFKLRPEYNESLITWSTYSEQTRCSNHFYDGVLKHRNAFFTRVKSDIVGVRTESMRNPNDKIF